MKTTHSSQTMCISKPNQHTNRKESVKKPKKNSFAIGKIKDPPAVLKCKTIFGKAFPFDTWVSAVHKHPTSLFSENILIMVKSNGDILKGTYQANYNTIDPVRYECNYTPPSNDSPGIPIDKQAFRLSARKYNGSETKRLFISPKKDADESSTKVFELFGKYCSIVVLGGVAKPYKRNRACD